MTSVQAWTSWVLLKGRDSGEQRHLNFSTGTSGNVFASDMDCLLHAVE
jgi:hypothetical protein